MVLRLRGGCVTRCDSLPLLLSLLSCTAALAHADGPRDVVNIEMAAIAKNMLSIEEKNRAPGSYKLTSSRLREWRIFKAFTSAERVMFATLTNDEIYTRLVAQWGSLGVIAALVGSIAFAEISNPPSNISSGFWASAFGLCSGLAAVVSLCSAVVCVLFFMALNAGPQDGARFSSTISSFCCPCRSCCWW